VVEIPEIENIEHGRGKVCNNWGMTRQGLAVNMRAWVVLESMEMIQGTFGLVIDG
jgi:hypothetical protein